MKQQEAEGIIYRIDVNSITGYPGSIVGEQVAFHVGLQHVEGREQCVFYSFYFNIVRSSFGFSTWPVWRKVFFLYPWVYTGTQVTNALLCGYKVPQVPNNVVVEPCGYFVQRLCREIFDCVKYHLPYLQKVVDCFCHLMNISLRKLLFIAKN